MLGFRGCLGCLGYPVHSAGGMRWSDAFLSCVLDRLNVRGGPNRRDVGAGLDALLVSPAVCPPRNLSTAPAASAAAAAGRTIDNETGGLV